MTQSKDNGPITITIEDTEYTTCGPVIDTNNIISSNWSDNTSYTVSLDSLDSTTSDLTFNTSEYIYTDDRISPDRVESMCKEYPALEKVWRNFKSVYDMCYQDYKGKLKERGLDDDIPF